MTKIPAEKEPMHSTTTKIAVFMFTLLAFNQVRNITVRSITTTGSLLPDNEP